MPDVHDAATRKRNMAAIKHKNTRPEILIRKFLHANGFRYRLHVQTLPGKPDIVLPKFKTIIEIHGCYFHRHPNCKFSTTPSADSIANWEKKFQGTVERDKKNKQALEELGWKVITIWECETKPKKIKTTIAKLPGKILSSQP